MVNTSKILTVSYGTFSCTLEGFDDSFDMMKAIAEYFRDLAQDDRYFGAEPPTPDADMLARIAEREVSRRVEARQERGAIVLRPSDAQEPVAEAPAPTPAPEPEAIEKAPEITAAPVMDTPQPEPEMIAPETVAPDAPEASPAPSFDEDSIAAKLSRIRAVVSRSTDAQAPEAPTYSEDQHAEDFGDSTAASIAASLRNEAAPAETFDAEEEDLLTDFVVSQAPESDSDDEGKDAVDTQADIQMADVLTEDPQLAEDIAAAEENANDFNDAPAIENEQAPTPVRARVIRMKRKDFEDALAEGELAEDAPLAGLSPEAEADLLKELAEVEAELHQDAPQPRDEQDFEEQAVSIFAEDDEDEPDEAPVRPQPQHAAKAGASTDVSRLMDKAEQEMERPDGAHRRSAIAHLRAAVEATRAETEAGGGLNRGDDSLDVYRNDLNSVVRPRRPRPAAEQPDAPRRPPVQKPAPLKLVAEQRVDKTPEQAPKPQIVRPRRVMLTDVQDEPAPQTMAEDASSFAEFAEQAGVKNLSELMEAAAAYMSYVEGRQKFSRPQLMNKARQVEDYAFSREDGLRSFGQLLRQGKIEKLKGGRFTVADDLIGFKPANRAAG